MLTLGFFYPLIMIYKILLIVCLYLPFQLAINPTEGIDLASIRIIIPLVFFAWLAQGLIQKKIIISTKMETWLLVSFIIISTFSFIFAENWSWGIRKLLFLFSFFPLYFITTDLTSRKPIRWKIIIDFLIIGTVLAAVVGLVQFFLQFIIGLDPTLKLWEKMIIPFLGKTFSQSVIKHPSWLVNLGGETVMRSIAFFPDPHMFAYYLNLILPWPVIFFFTRKKNKRLYAISALLIFTALILTFSRGAYLGIIAWLVIGAIYYFWNNLKRKSLLISVLILLSFLLFFGLANNPISQRLRSSFSSEDGSNQGRIAIWSESLNIIIHNPLGVGIGNYPLSVKPSADYREPIYSHNLFLDIAAETGILNALVFISLILFSLISFWKKSYSNKICLAGSLSLIGFSVHSFFENPLYSVHILPLLLILFSLSATYEKK
jgi:O-antigen ligase